MPDMQGRTVVVTGANSGIGLETATALAAMGARVSSSRLATPTRAVPPWRPRGAAGWRGRGAARGVRSRRPVLGAARRDRAARAGTEARRAREQRGAGADPTGRDGRRLRSNVRHEPPRTLPPHEPVARADRARRLPPGSSTWRRPPTARPAAGSPSTTSQSERHYRPMRVYGQSKLANMLFTLELARRLEGSGVTANSLHPGTVRTGYGGDGDTRGLLAFGIKISSPFFLSPAKGARTSVYLASSPEVAGVSGEYFVKCKPRRPKPWAQDRRRGGATVGGERAAGRPRPGPGRLSGAGSRHRHGTRHRPRHRRSAGRPRPRRRRDGEGCEPAGRAAGGPDPSARRERLRIGPLRRGRRR